MKRILSGLAACALSISSMAASFSDRPVRVVVPYGPGGGGDVVARPLANELGKQLGGSFYVDNRGGAGGNIAMEYVAQAPADGTTLVVALTAQLVINQSIYPKLRYDALQDFVPVTLLASAPYFLAVNSSLPVNTLADFLKLAKDKPGTLSYASTGNGSGLHLSMELLKSMTGINVVHVPYKGGGAALNDLVSGNIQAMFVSYGAGSPHIKSGRIKVLAVSSAQRSLALPQVPTIAQAGVPGYESGVWYALLAPRNTPAPLIQRLHQGTVRALLSKDLRERFAADGLTSIGAGPEDLRKYIESERVKWSEVVRRAGVRAE